MMAEQSEPGNFDKQLPAAELASNASISVVSWRKCFRLTAFEEVLSKVRLELERW
jgi:hypothetical protein